ncbi:MAG: M28 family peptidase, partial [Anaerolineales bacterium]|nr:M28 family peptidase [Anaerolineales bacterium]
SAIALIFALPILIAIPFFGFYALFSKKTDSPGTDDNGSGTSVVMDMAHRIKNNPTENVDVFFAWWGAEELGLFGSRQFIRRFHKKLNKDTFHILNIDCVGVCEYVTVHAGQGLWKRRKTDPQTVARLERLAADLHIKTIRSWESPISGGSSDHAGWVERGYRHATSLIREDFRPLSLPARVYAWLMRIPYANQFEMPHIHSPKDTLDIIKPEILHGTADLAEAYIREIDAQAKPSE